MAIYFHAEDVKFELRNKLKIKKWIKECIENHKFKLGHINFVFCSDEYLLEMNKTYLNHDYYTDIITFNTGEEESKTIDSDIFISLDRVKENAKTLKIEELEELNRVLIHGILHLLGWKDSTEEEKQIMRLEEDKCLSILGLY